MVKRIVITMAAVLVSIVASAQNRGDSTVTLFDDLKVPLVEKKYVANTNFQDNWYLSLYGGVTSNFGSDCSHSGFFRLMGPAAMLAVGKEITPVSGVRFQINYNRNTGVTDNQFGTVVDEVGDLIDTGFGDLEHNRFKWNSYLWLPRESEVPSAGNCRHRRFGVAQLYNGKIRQCHQGDNR